MTTNSLVGRGVRRALFTGAATAVASMAPAHAQEGTIQEIIVTGSRISTPNMQSISPVTAIAADDIAATGKVRIEDIINQLPQAFAAQGSNISNDSTGTATVNLRGVGAKRTLVLINGRRLMPGNPDNSPTSQNSGAADLNQIPKQLIERVEVLTGGASSVYGADAVGGVVNFIMNTRFEGVRVEANYSFYNHENDNSVASVVRNKGFELPSSTVNNGYTKDFSVLMGSNFADGLGNATFYATYTDVDPILQADYDYSACSFNSGDVFTCGGSSTTAPTRMRARNPNTREQDTNYIIDRNSGQLRPYASTDAFNFGPLNYYQRPTERYTGGAFINLDVAESHNAYGEFMFMKDESVAQIAPSGVFNDEFQVPCSNPLFTAQQRQLFCNQYGLGPNDTTRISIGRRNVEGGPRRQELGHEAFRTVLGLRGDLNDTWSYDLYGQHGQTSYYSIYHNDFSTQRTARALDVVPHPVTGAPVCRSALNGIDDACVPYNIWTQGGVNAAALNYMQIPLVERGQTEERVVNASFTGDLGNYGVKLPTASTGLMVNFGVEYREEESNLLPDAAYQVGDGAGQGGATLPISGGYRVKDIFTEARMALLEDLPAAQSLSAEIGYRYSDYSLDFETDTYKLGLEWTPIEDIRARVSFQHAVRVPNVAELFSAEQVTLDGTIDVCAGSTRLSVEECMRTGLSEALYERGIDANSASQYNGLVGGNPNLQPEEADTLSFGLAFQPSFVPGLRFQIDYFDIKIEDAIQNPNADFTLLLCARTGDPALCSKINRDRDGSLWQSDDGYIVDTLQNIGEIRTTGVDFDASYSFDTAGAGRFGVKFVGTYVDKFETTPQTGVTYDCAGLYGSVCGVPLPEWRHKMDMSWATPWAGIDVTLSWRYYDEVKRDAEDSNRWLGFLGTATGKLLTDSRLGSRSYLDLTGGMTLADRYTLRVGINNLLDKDPPLNGSESCPTGPCNGNTWPQVYDSLGRQIFGIVTIDF